MKYTPAIKDVKYVGNIYVLNEARPAATGRRKVAMQPNHDAIIAVELLAVMGAILVLMALGVQ